MKRFFSVLVASLMSASLVSVPVSAEAHGHRSHPAAKAAKASGSGAGKSARTSRAKKSEHASRDKESSVKSRSGKKLGKHIKGSKGNEKESVVSEPARHGHAHTRTASVQSAAQIRAREEEEALALWRNARPASPVITQAPQPAPLRRSEPERLPAVQPRDVGSRVSLPTEAGMSSVLPPASTAAPAAAAVPTAPDVPLAVPTLPIRLSSHGVPARAYAVDGVSFYQNGKKFRVRGLEVSDATIASEHAKQRLQKALDSGVVTIDAIDSDRAGNVLGNVRVNGRDVKEMLQ